MKRKGLLIKSLLLSTTIMCGLTMGAQQIQEGLVYYGGDGLTAHREQFTMVGNQRVEQPHGELPEHKGCTVNYVEAFYKNQAPIPLARQGENAGGYRYDGFITDNFHPTIRAQHLLYSDGVDIYEPHATQELWTRGQGTPGQEDVRIFISSHKDSLKLNWTPGIRIDTPNGKLPAGLYQFSSSENLTEEVPYHQNNVNGVRTNYFRKEKWSKVGSEQSFYINMPSHHLVSVPGMPEYILNEFPEAPKDFVDLKMIIDAFEQAVANNLNLQRPEQRIIFIGDARVGKDALAHYYAGSDLSVALNRGFRPARVELQGNPQLGSLSVVSGIIGSRNVGSWFDQAGQRVIWTTPGANGIETPLNDILNVKSLKTLLTKNNPSKYVLTIKESDLFEANYKNLTEVLIRLSRMFGYQVREDGTVDMGINNDLKNALSLVVSQTDRMNQGDLVDGVYLDQNGVQQPVKGILRNILEVMQSAPLNYDAGGMGILEYLVNHPERVSFFSLPNLANALYEPRDPLNTRESIQQSIDVANGNESRYMAVQNPADIHIVFKEESNTFIKQVLDKLNNQVTKYLSEDAVETIWNLCNQKILGHEGTVDELRDKLLAFSNKFNNANTQPLDDFVRDIESLIGTNGITRNINHIRYLQEKLGINTNYARDQWLAPLMSVMNNIRYLSSKNVVDGSQNLDTLNGINYIFDSQNKELTLVGYLLGMTDVKKFVENNLTRSGITGLTPNTEIRKLNLLSLRNLLADGSLSLKEATVVGITPEIVQTTQSVTLDLSARAHPSMSKAANDQVGTPGLPGRNGGSLVLLANKFTDAYKVAHPQNPTTFEIKKDGGSGQNGQEGGNSTSVPTPADGTTGDWNEHSSTPVSVGRGVDDPEKNRYYVSALKVKGGTDEDRKGNPIPWYKAHLSIDYTKKEYKQAGIKGTKGSNGKNGGAKGLKGHQGLLVVDCPKISPIVASNPPQDGSDGSGGSGSAGGLGGRVNYKITYNYRPGKYDHNGTEIWANAEDGTSHLGDGGRYREDGPRLLDNERGPLGDPGDAGTSGANTAGQVAPSPQITADQLETLKTNKLQLYSTQYYALAVDPVKQKLLGKFTNIPAQ
jgi:hypothetical protein